MDYVSTRNKERKVSAAYAIANGIAPDGGLYCPTAFPALTDADWKTLAESDYKGRSALILGKFLTDFTAEELADFASKAYADEKFGGADTAPVVKLGEGKNLLELWHGPTCAFKDMALQMLPHLLTASLRKTGETRTACILVATSGDTGKAALDGFHDVPGTKIMVYYPVDGVSPMQKLQMVTQEGRNVEVVAIRGNFDDAQSAVKRIFTDEDTRAALDKDGMMLSSANSINWGRLAPQIAYYVSAYCDMVAAGTIALGRQDQRLRTDGQLRQHPCGVHRQEDGSAGQQVHLRVQPQQRADRLLQEGRRVQPQPRFLHHHVAVDGHPDFVQPRASAVLRFRL